MADNSVQLFNASGGADIATELLAGVDHQKIKVEFGHEGSAIMVASGVGFGLPVEEQNWTANVAEQTASISSGLASDPRQVQFDVAGTPTTVSSSNPLPVDVTLTTSDTGAIPKGIFQAISSDGVGSGTVDWIGNYAGANQHGFITPPAGQVYRINRLLITYEDSSGMRATYFGNLGGPLVSGIIVDKHNGTSVVQTLTDGFPIKTNADWSSHCGVDADVHAWGAGADVFSARWSFFKAGQPIRLVGDSNESLRITFADNLTGLDFFRIVAQGYSENETQ